MRTFLLFTLTLALVLCPTMAVQAQDAIRVRTERPDPWTFYITTGTEWLFSFPQLDVNGSDRGGVVRFAPFFNMQGMVHYDLGLNAGLFLGGSVRNHGFIFDEPGTPFRYKYRTYNVGVPAGIKLGRMHETLVFIGYEVELPVNYKEKRFANERKEDKFNVWLSDRTERLFHTAFIGFQGPRGSTLTFRYQLNNFHDRSFTETVDGVTTQPYAALNAHVVSVALGYGLFNGERTRIDHIPGNTIHDVKALR
jgi:hypothetical protein